MPVPSGTARTRYSQIALFTRQAGSFAGKGAAVGVAYGVSDLTTMVSFYFADVLLAQAGYLNEDYRAYLDDLRQTVNRNDLNSEQYVDLRT